MYSQSWDFARLNPSTPTTPASPVPVSPPRLPYHQPRPALIRQPSIVQQFGLNLLGIPQEMRDSIWECIDQDIRSNPQGIWHGRPFTAYDGLRAVCRQIHFEIAQYWSRSMITQHRLDKFLDPKFSLSSLSQFRSLSIEIPFNMPAGTFEDVAFVLRCLAPFLHHLKLFFIGCDAYGTQTMIHGCGKTFLTSNLPKLPQDGQGFADRFVLINAIFYLEKLRSLVICNPNLPILQSHLLLHKPYLEKLYIESDPRTALHMPWKRENCGKGLLLPVRDKFPAVKELYISANAALVSVQVVSKLNVELEKLTWMCPDVSRQTGSMPQDILRDTDIILNGLRANSHNLHTLRICIESAIYENLNAYGILIGSVTRNLPHLLSLRRLELHIWSKSYWFGAEILESLPPNLERLYLSDRLVDYEDLHQIIEQTIFRSQQALDLHEYFRAKKGYEVLETAIDTKEELERSDYIPVHGKALTFINYQFQRKKDGMQMVVKEATGSDLQETPLDSTEGPILDEEKRLVLLKLNGRLLDRAHNRHLAHFPPSSYSPSSLVGLNEEQTSIHPDIEAAAAQLIPLTLGEVRTMLTFLSFCTGLTDDTKYFGNEKAAEEVFKTEKVAKTDELEERRYPMVVKVLEKEHWQCR